MSKLPLLLLLVPLLSGCTELAQPSAHAELMDTAGKVTGKVTLLPEVGGTRVLVDVSGLTPGQHGMHVHTNPRCEEGPDATGKVVAFGAAGGHFDPGDSKTHASPTTPNTAGHGGDLPMLVVGQDGRGHANFKTNKVTMSGVNSVFGHSIVIHADADDYATNPSGKSGARERCGVFVKGR